LVPDTTPAIPVSLPGDSGAIRIDSSDGSVVGLHFGGEDAASPLGDYAVAHAVETLLASKNITVL
jgi:hypothetical protein